MAETAKRSKGRVLAIKKINATLAPNIADVADAARYVGARTHIAGRYQEQENDDNKEECQGAELY
jgi:hypothetical protein